MLNHLLSGGIDMYWRRRAINHLRGEPGGRILDIATGTADFAIAAARLAPREVVGVDIADEMLAIGRKKLAARGLSGVVSLRKGEAEGLPFADGSFDAATVGFGVRNVSDLPLALGELRRVLVPGGRLAVLEITQPRGVLRPFYKLWFDAIVPFLGRVLPGGAAYTYLPASVRRFPGPDALAVLLGEAGFGSVRYRLLAGSIVALHTGAAA